MINRNTILTGIAAILMSALVLSWICSIAQAQTDTSFKPTDKFEIPANNSTINFATSGTYTQASLENNTWNFVDLRLNNSQRPEKLILRVSAQDSNVRIRSYLITNTTTLGGIRLRYNVTGRGTQTFNFGFIPKGGEWDIVFNRMAKAQNDGWRISPDATLTITGATANVSITYYGLPADYVDIASQPVYQQRSIAIITALAVVITVTLAALIRKNKEPLNQNKEKQT